MSYSPFELFRRNLKPLMVALTGLAMFAFVVLPVMDSYMRRNSMAHSEGVVATFDRTELTRSRVDYFTRNHNSTLRFLYELAEETILRGGTPKTAGFSYDPTLKRVLSVGINENPNFMGSIRTMMLAAQAQKDGFDLDDNTLQVWLQQFTDGMISDGDINGLLLQSTRQDNPMGRPHLYEQLRSHLLARVYEDRGMSGMFLSHDPRSGPLMTPEEQWSNFLKLNRSAVASAYGLLVSDYLPQTNDSPSEAEIKATYEAGKDRDPDDQSPEPAFHQRYAATIEFVSADLQPFLDAEVAKLTVEEIRAEYDKRLSGGAFQLPPSTTLPGVSLPAETAPAEAAPAETAPAEAAPAETAPAEAAPAETAPAETAPVETTTGDDAPTIAEPDGEAAAPSTDDQSSRLLESAVRLVSAQQDDTSESPQAESEPNPPAKAATETPATETPATETPATETPATETPATETPATETPAVESFEEVRVQIAEEMVADVARERMNAAMTDLSNRMRRYFSDNTIFQNNFAIGQAAASEAPKRPDLAALASELGMQHEVIGPYNAVTIQEEPIARSMEVGNQMIGQSESFLQKMFMPAGENSDTAALPLFAPVGTEDLSAGRQYVAWKINESPARTPSLDEVRGDVVLAIRTKEARKLAREAAEALVKQIEESSDKKLRDFVPEEKLDNYKADLGPFTWMNSFGFAGASIGNVPELDSVGNEFMKAVFESELNQPKVAENQSGRMVYVVEPTAFEPGLDALRLQFAQPANRMLAMLLGNGAAPIVNEFVDRTDERANFRDLTVEDER